MIDDQVRPQSRRHSGPPHDATPARPGRRAVAVLLATTVVVGVSVAAGVAEAAAPNLVVNRDLETGLDGWFSTAPFTVTQAGPGHDGAWSARVTNTGTTPATGALNDTVNTVQSTVAGHLYRASAYLRADAPGQRLAVRIMEYDAGTFRGERTQTVVAADTSWHRVDVDYTAGSDGATLDLNLLGVSLPGGASFSVDDVWLTDLGPSSAPPAPPTAPPPAGWRLAWSDEFDAALDPAAWTVENWSTFGDGNEELACLLDRPENVSTSAGVLTLRARREPTPVTCGRDDTRFPGGRSYTSAMIRTRSAWTYGRFEIRAKLPLTPGASQGLWPAFWLRPEGGGTGELDVLEAVGSGSGTDTSTRIHQTIWYDYTGKYPKQVTVATTPFDTSAGWHVYAAEWEPGEIRWYIDDQLTYTRTTQTTPWLDDVFNKPFQVRLNLAVGGQWPGSPDASTLFPAAYSIDYLRVYQR